MSGSKNMESIGEQLVELISTAKESDLDLLDRTIVSKEKELESLRTIRKTIAVALGKMETAGQRMRRNTKARVNGTASAPAQVIGTVTITERRNQVALFLLRNGSKSTKALSESCNIPIGSMGGVMNFPWFVSGGNGYELTPLGREEARKLGLNGA